MRLMAHAAAALAVVLATAGAAAVPADPPHARASVTGSASMFGVDDVRASDVAQDIATIRRATTKYRTNLDAARADGYMVITQNMPGMGWHYLNPSITDVDLSHPQILVYQETLGGPRLVAVEWVFGSVPEVPPMAGATYGSFPAACHYDDGVFVPAASKSDCADVSPSTGSGFTFWHPDLVTFHAWIWAPNPAGLYHGTNPRFQ
jgi:hypothetical protein